jgi:hypothetical protein
MNQSILHRWAAHGEIVSNDGDTATVAIPEGKRVLVCTMFVIKRAETNCSRARFIDEYRIGAWVEILCEDGRQPSCRILH